MYKHQNSAYSKWSRVLQLLLPSNKPSRQSTQRKQDDMKSLHRRGIYIPNDVTNGESQNTWQLYYLYRATFEKLHRPSVSLSKSIHLKQMLYKLQERQSELSAKSTVEEDDNVPLGALIERPSSYACSIQPLKPCYYSNTKQNFPIQLM